MRPFKVCVFCRLHKVSEKANEPLILENKAPYRFVFIGKRSPFKLSDI